jgi:hypothetical protein
MKVTKIEFELAMNYPRLPFELRNSSNTKLSGEDVSEYSNRIILLAEQIKAERSACGMQ